MTTSTEHDPDYAVAPAEHIEEWAQESNRSLDDLGDRLGLSPQHLDDFMVGAHDLTPAMADALHELTGVSAGYWSRLEVNYRTRLDVITARLREDFDALVNNWGWVARVEDTVGGWCLQPDWDKRSPAQGGIVIVSLIPTEQLAQRIAMMHNALGWEPPIQMTRERLDEGWRFLQGTRRRAETTDLEWPDEQQ